MTPLVSFAHATAYRITPPQTQLPPCIWKTLGFCNKIHATWHYYRRIELYRNPDNLSHLVIGHILNFTIGDSRFVRLAAQCLLVATRLLECVQQQKCVWKAWNRLVITVKGGDPFLIPVKWELKNPALLRWISPSTVYCWRYHWHLVSTTAQSIFLRIFSLFKHLFKLSMKVMDVVDALSWDASTKYDAVPESFVNMKKWVETIVENKEELLRSMEDHRSVLEQLLNHAPITYQQLYEGVSKLIEKTEKAQAHIKNISQIGNRILIDLGQRTVGGIRIITGTAKTQARHAL